jgi:hypothetical protein
VSTNTEAAYTHPESWLRKKSLHSTNLSSIPESHTIKGSFETGYLGWIVAITEDASTRWIVSTTKDASTTKGASITEDASTTYLPAQEQEQSVKPSSGFAHARTLTLSEDSLALVCFDTYPCATKIRFDASGMTSFTYTKRTPLNYSMSAPDEI